MEKERKESFSAETVRRRLQEMEDTKYRDFHSGLLPGVENVLGVRTPLLRSLAKEIARGDWQTFLEQDDCFWYESVLLQGLVIGYAKMDFSDKLVYIRDFIPKINNWAVCDIFCSTLKETKKHKKEMWEFLQPYLKSDLEYEIRFGVVMLLGHFMEEGDVNPAFSAFDEITSEAYYVRMAIAWAVSVYFVHFPKQTMEYLQDNRLDDWTYHKALQKITESLRVDGETKERIRKMKRC